MKSQNQTSPTIELTQHLQKHWTTEERQNVETVVDFFQHLMNEHDFEYTIATYGGGSYIQHNRAIPDEISGLVGYVERMVTKISRVLF